MAFKKRLTIISFSAIIISLYYIPLCYANKFKLYAVKRPFHTLRYQTSDGYLSYFQRKNAELVLSTRYEINTILTGKENDHFFVYDSAIGENIIILQMDNFYNKTNHIPDGQIYVGKLGSKDLVKKQRGSAPRLQLVDQWYSYYYHPTKTIYYKSFNNQEFNFQVKLNAYSSYGHIPQTYMINQTNAIYTDINKQGKSAIMHINKILASINPIYVSKMNEDIEICLESSRLFVLVSSENSSRIFYQDFDKQTKLSAPIEIYKNDRANFGSLVCDYKKDQVFFITENAQGDNVISKILVKEKKEEIIISEFGPDSLWRMGTELIMSSGDKYYVYTTDVAI